MLRDQSLKPHPARSLEQLGTDFAPLERRHEDPLGSPAEQLRQVGLAQVQWQPAGVVPVVGQAVEGVELDLVVVLAGVKGVEVGDTIDAEHHGLAVDDELALPNLPRRLDDPWIPAGPVCPPRWRGVRFD